VKISHTFCRTVPLNIQENPRKKLSYDTVGSLTFMLFGTSDIFLLAENMTACDLIGEHQNVCLKCRFIRQQDWILLVEKIDASEASPMNNKRACGKERTHRGKLQININYNF
jgi:hypothetical protein